MSGENKKKKGFKKRTSIILIVIGVLIVLAVGIYFMVFYHKTILYKCSNTYNPSAYSTKRLDRKNWSCKIDGIYSCIDCEFKVKEDKYAFFNQLRDGGKKNSADSYDFIIFNSDNKEKIAIIERASFDSLVYNDDKLVAVRIKKYDDNENLHSVIYNLNKKSETVVLNSAIGFHSRRYSLSLSDTAVANSKDNEIEEKNISNNLIIATEPGGESDTVFINQLFGLANIETGNIVVPIENKTLYRTEYGNFIATIDTDRGPIIRLYNSNGELKYEQGILVPNPADVVEDVGDDLILVDNLINYNSKYFELMNYNGKSASEIKIYWSDIINEFLNQIRKTKYSEKYTIFDDSTLMDAYKVGNFRITGGRRIADGNAIDASSDNAYYITFSFYDSESVNENNRVYKPLIASVSYELNLTKNTLKKLGNN